jgi:hypothetical protein
MDLVLGRRDQGLTTTWGQDGSTLTISVGIPGTVNDTFRPQPAPLAVAR